MSALDDLNAVLGQQPDGSVSAPLAPSAGGSLDDINAALAGTLPPASLPRPTPSPAPQDTSAWRWPKFLGGEAAAGLAEGTGGLANLMTNMTPVGQLGRTVQDWFKPSVSPEQSAAIDKLRDFGEVAKVPLRAAGIIDRPDVQPQNTAERYAGAGVRGAAQALPSLVMGGGVPGIIGRAIQTLGQGTIGGFGRQAASDLTAPAPGQEPSLLHRYAPTAGDVIGSLGAGLTYGGINKLAGVGGSTTTLDASRRLGITPNLMAGQVESPFVEHATAALTGAPGAAGNIRNAAQADVRQWGDALEKTAGMLGESATPTQLGAVAQPLSTKWIKDWQGVVDTKFANSAMHNPPSSPTPPTSYRAALTETADRMPGLRTTGEALEPDLTQKLLDSLVKDTKIPPRPTGLLDASDKPIMAPGMEKTPSWQDMDELRKRIGRRLDEPSAYSDPGNGLLRQLYGAVLDDMERAAGARGPKALDSFKDARATSHEGHNFIESTLSKIINGDKIAPEQAGRNIFQNAGIGGTFLQTLRDKLPQAADEAAAFKLRDMGRAVPRVQDPEQTVLSPGTFMTKGSYPNLSDEAHDALFGNDPRIAQRVADLRTTAHAATRADAVSNTSRTAAAAKWLDAIMGVGGTVGVASGHIDPLTGAALIGGPIAAANLASKALTSPGLTRFVARPSAGGRVPFKSPMIPGLLGGF